MIRGAIYGAIAATVTWFMLTVFDITSGTQVLEQAVRLITGLVAGAVGWATSTVRDDIALVVVVVAGTLGFWAGVKGR